MYCAALRCTCSLSNRPSSSESSQMGAQASQEVVSRPATEQSRSEPALHCIRAIVILCQSRESCYFRDKNRLWEAKSRDNNLLLSLYVKGRETRKTAFFHRRAGRFASLRCATLRAVSQNFRLQIEHRSLPHCTSYISLLHVAMRIDAGP